MHSKRLRPSLSRVPWFGAATLSAALVTGPVLARDLALPTPATVSAERQEVLASYALPIGPWAMDAMPTKAVEGPMQQTAWQLDAPGATTLQLLTPLRDQLLADGFSVIYTCDAAACGGYDFRYGTDILPEPDMHVDLGDFRYLAVSRDQGPDGPEYVTLIVSRSATKGYVQMTRVGGKAAPALSLSTKSPEPVAAPVATDHPAATAPDPVTATDLATALDRGTAFALDDLVFPSGTAALTPGTTPQLEALADWLKANPARAVTLVGHTDASGSLDANIAISRDRAAAVRARLIGALGVPGEQVTADGVGYLSPRDTNLTEAGRTRNRRVEVMLTITQ